MANIFYMADSLQGVDRSGYLPYQHDMLDTREMVFGSHRDGLFDDASWKDWNKWYSNEFPDRPRFAWEENRNSYTHAAFMSFVDTALLVPRSGC